MRVKNRLRVCQHCTTEYELGVEGGRHKYCSSQCASDNHYQRWSATGCRDKSKMKDQRLRREFGLDLSEFETKLIEQDYKCSCCLRVLTGGRDTHVDHNHLTGLVRDLLCSSCNQALGLVKEDTHTLFNMIRYLRKFDGS